MKPKNPCKSRCYDYDPLKNLCNGCGLRMSERSRWYSMSNERKRKILARIKKERGGKLSEG